MNFCSENTRTNFRVNSGSVSWQAPSNIALIKYWGKIGNQIPGNPSISMSLSKALTHARLNFTVNKEQKDKIKFSLYFSNQREPKFEDKISIFLAKAKKYMPFLSYIDLEFYTENTFPHSAGIASSASSMAALALCLCDLERELFPYNDEETFFERASFLARLGSGSACRSLFQNFVAWGAPWNSNQLEDERSLKGVEVDQIHPSFMSLQDAILIVSGEEKAISSTIGHSLMKDHPYAKVRYEQATHRFEEMQSILKKGNWNSFCEVVETEALELHGLMMNSKPSYILMKPKTLELISLIRNFREKTGVPLCFTLDAGPNIHLLYPEKYRAEVHQFINRTCLEFLDQKKWIDDCIGRGPLKK